MTKTRYIETKCHLSSVAEHLAVAYWIEGNFHPKEAREELTHALCGSYSRDALEEMIVEAIDNVHDMDVTFEDYARSIVDAILNYAVPLDPDSGK